MPKTAKLVPYAVSLYRLIAGFTFMAHGLQKLFGMFGGIGGHSVHLMSQLGFAGILEFGGGALILVGLFTRPVAFLLCGQMAYAYFTAHAPRGFWPISNGGELAVLYCFSFLLLMATGPGPVSLDRALGRRS